MLINWSEVSSIAQLYGDEFASAFEDNVLGQTVTGISVARQLYRDKTCLTDQAEWVGRSVHNHRLVQGSESVSAEIRLGNGKTLHLCRCWSGADWDTCSYPSIFGDNDLVTSNYVRITDGEPRFRLDVDAGSGPAFDPSPLIGRRITGYVSGSSTDLLEMDGAAFLWVLCHFGGPGNPPAMKAAVGQWTDRDQGTAEILSKGWQNDVTIER